MDSGLQSIFITHDPPTHHYRAISTYGQRPHLQYVTEHGNFDDSQRSRIIIKSMTTRSTSPPALFNFVLRSHIIEGRKDVLAPIGSRAFLHYLYTLLYYRCGTYEKKRTRGRGSGNGNSLEKLSIAIRILTGRKHDKLVTTFRATKT